MTEDTAFPRVDSGVLADTLIAELERSWRAIPCTTRAVMIGVAAALRRDHEANVLADIEAMYVIDCMVRNSQKGIDNGKA